jgi:hypothetical protein
VFLNLGIILHISEAMSWSATYISDKQGKINDRNND